MVGIGIVGIGFMGMIHYLAASRLPGARVVALCSRDARKLDGDWTSIQGNFGPRGTIVDLSGQKKYRDLSALLADPEVDLVDLCVPNDDHARFAIQALEAGKHVLVEKPIALDPADADAMLAAAKANGRMLMVAHVLPFFPEFAYAAEAVRSERFGALLAAHFTRVIARPNWSKDIGDVARSGGPAIDLHIHDTHYIGLLCGTPVAVRSRGVERGGAVVHLATQYRFDGQGGGPAVSAVSGALSQPGRSFTHGFEIALDDAVLTYQSANFKDCVTATPLTILRADGSIERPDLGPADPIEAFARELAAATEAVATGVPSALLSAELARSALVACRAEVESVRSGVEVLLESRET